jgi:uncharacterized protein (TIGR02453 family)
LALADRLIKEISSFYDLWDEIRPNDCIFRINRDTRFSKDKTPYKTNFWIEITPTWKRVGLPCFYLHIQPGNQSFIAGGLYMPESKTIGLIREWINKKWKDLKKIIDKVLKSESFYLYEDAVKTAPRWYKKDNPNIELLKLKHRIVERPVSDKELLGNEFEKELVKDFKKISPFVEWLQDRIDEQ